MPSEYHNSPSIGDYGFLADCHSMALVSKEGSIDWCCMPRIDSGSIFGRILDQEKGGYCRIFPRRVTDVKRRYLPGTLVLETTFLTSDGEVRLLDCFPMRRGGIMEPYQQILRFVDGVRGSVEIDVEIVPRFDYGAILPWVRNQADHYLAFGGSSGLIISGDLRLEPRGRHDLAATFTVSAGERRHLSIIFRSPELIDHGSVTVPDAAELDQRLAETISWWEKWSSKGAFPAPYADLVGRSAIVLKGLSNAPTGAIAAAATTSLPEAPGGGRNWDYRFTWIRDSVFAFRSLAKLGYRNEADGFRRFIERSAAGNADELQVLFGVGGERRLHEYEIKEMAGYHGARPVRVGNAASVQLQLDMYGELMGLAWRWHQAGHSPDDDYWKFLVEIVNAACRAWRKPDCGIWEMRGTPRHFVLSKVMCWFALDRGVALAAELGREAPISDWVRERDEIRRIVEQEGYDDGRGIFVQSFGRSDLDASLLLLPTTGFVAYGDERMLRTTDAVMEKLTDGGILRRYLADTDGLEGREGAFVACSFWLVECLARQRRLVEAHEIFRRTIRTGNDLGLFAEEFDVSTGDMLGNFPQGLSHLSLIAAAVSLADEEGEGGNGQSSERPPA